MEPRNIGVFVWWKGEIRAKFLTTLEATFINEPDTYERWIDFWKERISGESVRPSRGKPVSKSDPQCLEALISTQKGNYILVDSGELLSPIKKRDIGSATDYLFNDLVAPVGAKSEEAQESFTHQCNALFDKAKITFKRREPVECMVKGVTRHLHPDYYIGNGKPEAIFQQAKLSQEQSVNSAVLIVDTLLDQGIISPEHCRVLVRSADIKGAGAEEGLKIFDRLCGTIDIGTADARDKLAQIAKGNGRVTGNGKH